MRTMIQPRLIHLQHSHEETRPGISEHILLVCNTLSAGILITLSRYTSLDS
ncbi:Ancylostoma secreted protein [Clarias magur]|uniref:Ancylostoma secreted protein n=1 Tax=Clarias magur TaxID=1594786 RepID=A0A8J4WZD9_CLAMG|nr:Ancylostoma secreted protein [Clarias magur]